MSSSAIPQRFTQIDLLKGLAIIGVMAQHAFPPAQRHQWWDVLHIDQAVPVFFVLMGLNATRSLDRAGTTTLRRLLTRRYAAGRFRRLMVPFLLVWPVAALVGLATGQAHFGPLIVLGVVPLKSAPGNYFVTIAFEFAVAFPLIYWGLRRSPLVVSLALIAADVGFDLLAPHISWFASGGAGGYVYDAAIVKYAIAILAGFWLSRVRITPRLLLWLTLPAAGSCVYLVALHQDPGAFGWLTNSFSRATNFLSVFYAVWLTVAGLILLPSSERSLSARPLAALGRASWHVFLVQLVWFGVLGNDSGLGALGGIAACIALGCTYSSLLERSSLGGSRGWTPSPSAPVLHSTEADVPT